MPLFIFRQCEIVKEQTKITDLGFHGLSDGLKMSKRVTKKSDRISNLPEELAEKILVLLPIRDAVRTSVLSSKWRYRSARLPCLVFDGGCVPTEHYTFPRIVDHVLMTHIGSIIKFRLDQENLSFRDIDRWILHLSRNDVKQFALIKSCGDSRPYLLPACMFAGKDLIKVNLCHCLLQPPPTFKGFGSLGRLRLENVTLEQHVLEKLTCSSVLRTLILRKCVGFQQLKIDAPKLVHLFLYGDVEDINILNTFKVVDAHIYFPVQSDGRCRSMNFLKLFENLRRHIKKLHINSHLARYLHFDSSLEELPHPCRYLECLALGICYKNPEDVLLAPCLLKSSPALKVLRIVDSGSYHNQADAGKLNSCFDKSQSCSFTKLKHVELNDFPPVKPATDFVKFLLSISPALETMTLYEKKSVRSGVGSDLARILLLPRASVNAQIIYLTRSDLICLCCTVVCFASYHFRTL